MTTPTVMEPKKDERTMKEVNWDKVSSRINTNLRAKLKAQVEKNAQRGKRK